MNVIYDISIDLYLYNVNMIYWFKTVRFLHHVDLMLQITRIADNYLKNSLGMWKHAPRLALTLVGCHVPEGFPNSTWRTLWKLWVWQPLVQLTHCIAHYWLLASDLWAVARWYSAQLVAPASIICWWPFHSRFPRFKRYIRKIGCIDKKLTSTMCQVFKLRLKPNKGLRSKTRSTCGQGKKSLEDDVNIPI